LPADSTKAKRIAVGNKAAEVLLVEEAKQVSTGSRCSANRTGSKAFEAGLLTAENALCQNRT
jgi:hypothetical protein